MPWKSEPFDTDNSDIFNGKMLQLIISAFSLKSQHNFYMFTKFVSDIDDLGPIDSLFWIA